VGKWKYVRPVQYAPGYARDKNRKEVAELYDLEADLGETKNLAAQHPELVEKFEKQLSDWWAKAKEEK
jgi:arylsulfatase A-like enzyme